MWILSTKVQSDEPLSSSYFNIVWILNRLKQITCDKILFSHTRRWYQFLFLYFSIFRCCCCCCCCYFMLLFIFTKILLFFYFSWKLFYFFMFRDVPECSGMFRNVPCFIDGPLSTVSVWLIIIRWITIFNGTGSWNGEYTTRDICIAGYIWEWDTRLKNVFCGWQGYLTRSSSHTNYFPSLQWNLILRNRFLSGWK